MKYIRTKQMQVVCEMDPRKFQEEFNATMQRLASEGQMPELVFPQNAQGTVYIIYYNEAKVPECLEDEFSLRGEYYHCCDCPHFEEIKSADRRIKYYYCPYCDSNAWKDRRACEHFLRTIKENEN